MAQTAMNGSDTRSPYCLMGEEIFASGKLQTAENSGLHTGKKPILLEVIINVKVNCSQVQNLPRQSRDISHTANGSSVMCEEENKQVPNISKKPQEINCSILLLPIKSTNPHILWVISHPHNRQHHLAWSRASGQCIWESALSIGNRWR